MSEDEEFFRKHFPAELLRNITRAVVDTGKAAYQRAVTFRDANMFLDADVAMRRLLMEQALRGLILPAGFQCQTPRTPSGSYALIRSKRIVLTAVTRDEDVARIEPYRYRETLAKGRQLTLLGEPGPFDPNATLYALLVYGGTHGREMPSLAKIAFPLPDGTITSSISLMSEFPELFGSAEEDRGDEQAEPRLREEAEGEEEGGQGGE